jgi:dCMP deaminase
MSTLHLRPNIDEYAMILACAASLHSEDPRRKVGAVALDHENRIIATAYNGLPSGHEVHDDWWLDDLQRRKFVMHAEANLCSLTHRGQVKTVAVTTIPCGPCAMNLVAHGVRRVVYGVPYQRDVTGLEVLQEYGIEIIHLPLSQINSFILRMPDCHEPIDSSR